MSSLLDNFEYENKSWYLKQADLILSPLRGVLNGKTVKCVKKEDSSITFKVPNHISPSTNGLFGKIDAVINKVGLGACSVLLSPILLLALGMKANYEEETNLRKRFTGAQTSNFSNNSPDKIEEKAILEDRLVELEKYARNDAWSKYEKYRQIAHILGDKEIARHVKAGKKEEDALTKFEGGCALKSGLMLSEELSRFSEDKLIGEEIKEAKRKIDEYIKWSICCLSFNEKSDLDNLSQDFKQRIESLQVGESFLFPIESNKHSITVKFICQEENRYAIKVYNVGAGVSRHHFIIPVKEPSGQETYYTASFNIQSIPLTNLTSLDNFIQPFLRYAKERKPDDSCDRFYNFLQSSFKEVVGKENFCTEPTNIGEIKRIQQSGLCSWKCLLAALKDSMSVSSYKRFILLMKRERWWDMFQEAIKDNNNMIALRFYVDGCRQLKKAFLKYAKVVNDDEFALQIFNQEQRSSLLDYEQHFSIQNSKTA